VPPDEERSLRPFWSGTLSFGLVSVPVDLFPGQRSTHVGTRMLAPDGTPLERRWFCPIDDEELSDDDIVRGFEREPEEFVVVTDEELESVEPDKSRDIDLQRFVPRGQLPPMYFERSYVLTPSGSSTKPYRLLAETMEEADRAGLATFVMRGKEYVVAIVADDGILRAETLRFADEVRAPEDVGLPERSKAPAKRKAAFVKAIRGLEEDQIDVEELEDVDAERLRRLVKEEGEIVEPPGGDVDAGAPVKVLDLVAVLKRQLEEGGAGKDGGSVKGRGSDGRGASGAGPGPDLRERTRDELYEMARDLDVPGRSKMTKDELVAAVRDAGGG
jgi:DNA end-binding protein Ku